MCAKCGIEVKLERVAPRRARKLPAKLNDSVVLETVGQKQIVDSKCTFRQHIFIPVIKSRIDELVARFSGHSNSVMLGNQCLNPSDESFLDL